MLVSKSRYEPDDIISFKLTNGDEIVAKLVEETDTTYVVSKPTVVIPSPQGLGLIQAMFSGNMEKKIEINKSHVVMSIETVHKMRDYYIQTTTGIQPVSKGSIVV